MKKFLISYRMHSTFDMSPISSTVITLPHWPSKKELEGKELDIGRGCPVSVLSICQVPMDWDKQ